MNAPVTQAASGELAAARACLAAAEAARSPVATQVAQYRAEMAEIERYLAGVTPESSDPLGVVSAQSRLLMLERAIAQRQPELQAHDQTVAEARSALALVEQHLNAARDRLAALRDVRHPGTQLLRVADFCEWVRNTRAEIARIEGVEVPPVVLTVK